MNTKSTFQDQEKEFPVSDKKGTKIMNSTIDRKRIFIFVAIAYGSSIAVGLALYFNGGVVVSSPYDYTRLAYVLMIGWMFAPTVANIATRLITREGWSNTLLRPNFRRGWRFYLAAWFLPVLAPILGGLIYFLLFRSRFDPSMTSLREMGAIPKDMNAGMFLITQVGITLAVGAPLNLLLGSFGEEFGWRAYLLPKLMPLGSRKAVDAARIAQGGAAGGRHPRRLALPVHLPGMAVWIWLLGCAVGWCPGIRGARTVPECVSLVGHPAQWKCLARGAGSRYDQHLALPDDPLRSGRSGLVDRPPTAGDRRRAGVCLAGPADLLQAARPGPTRLGASR